MIRPSPGIDGAFVAKQCSFTCQLKVSDFWYSLFIGIKEKNALISLIVKFVCVRDYIHYISIKEKI